MLAVGRRSKRSAWPLEKLAAVVPTLATLTVQSQGVFTTPEPLTLFVRVAVRSGPARTVSEHVLLLLLASTRALFGSTTQVLPVRGFANTPGADAVAVTVTWRLAAPGIVT